MKKLFNLLLLTGILCLAGVVKASAFTGSTITDGGQYYLYNLYQSKFLSYGNTWGTQVSLDNSKPLLCTIEASGSGYTINTHYSLTEKAYKATYNNYICIVDGTPVVNANYGDADDSYTTRAAQVFTFTAVDGGYNITYDTNTALMFDAGSACTVADISTSFNASKSVWKLVSVDEYNTYKAKKRFTVASLNVDGMPASIKIAGVYDLSLNPDSKGADGATAIGAKLKTLGYDVVGMSEDFNYHSQIWNEAWNNGVTDADNGIWSYNATTHRGAISVTASTYVKYLASTSPLFDTDGLCLFYKTANVDQSTLESSESWTAWNEHYGYTSDGADGMIDKGYRYYTVKLADGTEFDLYILHMDAETSASDNAARASQLTQLATAIKASTNGRPIIIMGDTNCRYTRDKLKALLIDALNADDRFTVKDPWIEYGRDGVYPTYGGESIMADAQGYLKGEVVDKVIYVNNTASTIRINALNYAQDLSFVNSSGEALADHWPAVVEFEYHTYNPEIDDVVTENINGTYYLRNKESGAFLKAGGWWGTHAVQGTYGKAITFTQLSNGKYNLSGITQGDPYMDNASGASWNLVQDGKYYSFTYDDNGTTKALTGNDPTTFPDEPGPNTRYVTCAAYSASDDYQKWEMLTLDDLKAEMLSGTAVNPYNCTFLMKDANFDRNDADGATSWNNDISSTAARMTSNLSDGKNDFAFGNSCAEVYIDSWSGTSTPSTQWAISQTLNDLPNGTYRVTCQAFQRINHETGGYGDIYVHAVSGSNESKQRVPIMYTEPKITDSSFGGTAQSGDYYYPDNMAQATLYFNAGYYQMTLANIKVENGTLTVSIDKTSDTGKSNTCWTCFDNFQIYYLGEITDGSQYYLYNVDEGGFLNQGNNAGTQASLSSEGLKWTVKIADGGYTINRDGQSNYLGVAWNGLYVDWGNADKWDIAKISDGIYNITSTDRSTLVGWGGDPGNTVVAPALLPTDKEPRGTRWMLMSESNYNTYRSGLSSAFSARQAAWTIMRSAKANGIDYSALQKVYDKLDATATEISTAADAVKTTITTMASNEASVTNPVEVSFYINNATCGYEDFTGWTNTNFGSYVQSMPNNGNDIALAPRFYEKWVSTDNNGTLASSGSFKQTLENLPNGCYYLVADAIAVNQANKTADVTGAILYAGDKSVTISTPNEAVAEFKTDPFVVDNGTAEIGFKLENATANWVAIDNFRLYYVGGTKVNMTLSYVARKGTFCSPYDVVIPDNVTAYQVSKVTNNSGTRTLILSKVADAGETLIAGTPVIVCLSDNYTTEANLSKTYYGPAKITSDQHSDGYLCGVYTESQRSIAAGNYLLQRQDGVLAFYKIVGDPLTLAKYRAYLLSSAVYDDESSTGNSKLLMRFVDDEETAIESVNGLSTSECESFYSVSGAKLSKLQHGINIIRMSDGSVKKVYIK